MMKWLTGLDIAESGHRFDAGWSVRQTCKDA
jgi:hypothetical protein